MEKDEKLVTAYEVMEYLGIKSRRTLYTYKEKYGLPEYKLNPSTTRYNMDEVKAWAKRHEPKKAGRPSKVKP